MERLLVNPSSSGGAAQKSLPRLEEIAAQRGAEVIVSRSAEHLVEEARRAVEERLERLVVAGGDGTFYHVIQGLAGSDTRLGLIPLGRGNDLSASLGIPLGKLDEAIDIACGDGDRRIDLGKIGDLRFSIYAGVGFDSEAAEAANAAHWFRGGALSYVYGALRTLAGFEAPTIHAEWDDGGFDRKTMFVTIANCPRFGGGMQIAPNAPLDDGRLRVVSVQEVPKLKALFLLARVFTGTHVQDPAVSISDTTSVRLALSRPIPLYADGERLWEVGSDGVEITVDPGALRVIAPTHP